MKTSGSTNQQQMIKHSRQASASNQMQPVTAKRQKTLQNHHQRTLSDKTSLPS
jgi:hypothetical protein